MPAERYFDNAATTPLDPRVLAAMLPYLQGEFGNPSSLHWAGRRTRDAVESARGQVAALLNAQPGEIVFTASGTEADNMALHGVAAQYDGNAHIVTSAFEHPAVLKRCQHLQKKGCALTVLPVTADGLVDPDELRRSLRAETRLVSVMAANNVVGTLPPIAELGRIAREYGALFHTDAVQAAGKIPLDVRAQPIDLLSLSAHKLHGPQGVGALFVRGGVKLAPLVHGGGQERGLRSATENVAGIVGFGEAAWIARTDMAEETARLVQLREELLAGITVAIDNAYLVGHRYRRLPGLLALGFSGQENEAVKLLLALDEAGIAASTGSACSAHSAAGPSYVLQAMGFDPLRARGLLRLSLGRFNTQADVARLLAVLPQAVAKLRPLTSTGFVASR
jgi:cysteine desulfurase